MLKKGESIELKWEINESRADDFSDCVRKAWEYSYDLYRPAPVETPYTDEIMKDVLSNFFVESYVDNATVKYFSGVELRTDDCGKNDVAEVGFVGRTLLNAFNALEYGEEKERTELVDMANSIFDSYLQKGFSKNGFFNEVVHFKRNSVEKIIASVVSRKVCMLFCIIWIMRRRTDVIIRNGRCICGKCLITFYCYRIRMEVFHANLRMICLL